MTPSELMNMPFDTLYKENVSFVWSSLRRLGIREADLPDLVQDVFLLLYQKKSEFAGLSQFRTWLFGFCVNKARDHRKRAYVRKEVASEEDTIGALLHQSTPPQKPSIDLQLDLGLIAFMLDDMPEDQRVVFIMFELEEKSGQEIADELQLPLGTVRSRLRLARDFFESAVLRFRQSMQRSEEMNAPAYGQRKKTS